MIKLRCPKCKGEAKVVNVDITFRVTSTIGMVGTSRGVEKNTDRPMDLPRANGPAASEIEEYRCAHCGKVSNASDWVIVFYCSECGNLISCPVEYDTADAFAKAHTCEGGHGVKCARCWVKLDMTYCPDCRSRSRCAGYQHFTELKNTGAIPEQSAEPSRRSIRARFRRDLAEVQPEAQFAQPPHYNADPIRFVGGEGVELPASVEGNPPPMTTATQEVEYDQP